MTLTRTILFSLAIAAHSSAQAPAGALRFDVASIKKGDASGGRAGMEILPGGGLRMTGVTLKHLISFAYDVDEIRISGGPGWTGSAGFDVLAKPEQSASAEDRRAAAPGTTAWARIQERTRTLLADRFQLSIHFGEKPSSVYALVLAKDGPKMTARKPDDDTPAGTMRSNTGITGRAGTMQMLATVLSHLLERPVEDRTGLTGRYDYKLEYGPETPDGEPLVRLAIQEQLGLKLEPARGALKTIIIDRAERPSAN